MASELQEAQVVATFSRQMNLRLPNGSEVRARIRGKRLQPVCGDRVLTQPLKDEPEWLITDVLPRRNQLTRPDNRGKIEILASNLDMLAVVSAEVPTPDWFVVDRYLAAAEEIGIPALVIFNKIDLGETSNESRQELDVYMQIGYTVCECSAETGQNVSSVESSLQQKTSIIVGQSGVGKSSLINRMIEGTSLRVGELSVSSGEGRHTTVNSILLPLPAGGGVIDSPGVRDYAPALVDAADVAVGFREIAAAAQRCRFANCRHLREPGCAVISGVAGNAITSRRYASYKRLIHTTDELIERRL